MKKIIIDLDVVTIATWEKEDSRKEAAQRLLGSLGNYIIVTPFFLLELLSKWGYTALKERVIGFYLHISDSILTNEEIDAQCMSLGINDTEIINALKAKGIKGEDALLILLTSIFDIDHLITYNRKHLRNQEKTINEVLRSYGIRPIKIVSPEEL